MEMFFGLLEPYASLYERAFSQNGAIREHERLEHVLRHEFHIKVHRMRDTIVEAAEQDNDLHDRIVRAANEGLNVTGDNADIKLAIKRV